MQNPLRRRIARTFMMLRLIIASVMLFSIYGCATKSTVEEQKSYEDYFPPIQTESETPVQESQESESSFYEDEEQVAPVVDVPEEKPDDIEPKKSVCKAKVAPGPKKIGKPYYVGGIKYYPLDSADGYVEEGIASWYGPGFHGKLTANGETYNQKAMTAAHKTLPLPTFVRVENLENGKEIVVRVNDRGPFSKGRIIDLSEEGARRLGMLQKGTAKVRVSVLSEDADCYVSSGKEVDLNKGSFAVQIGAFSSADNASALASQFGKNGAVSQGYVNGRLLYRVHITGYTTKASAEAGAKEYEIQYPGAFVVAK